MSTTAVDTVELSSFGQRVPNARYFAADEINRRDKPPCGRNLNQNLGIHSPCFSKALDIRSSETGAAGE